MKKTITLLTTALLTLQILAQQQRTNPFVIKQQVNSANSPVNALTINSKPGKEIHSRWDTVANTWILKDSTIYNYNTLNNITQSVRYSVPSGSKNKNVYTYNANQKEATYTSMYWSGAAYLNSSYNFSTYDANNNKTSLVYQYWVSATSTWNNSSKETNTYNVSNQWMSSLYATWNSTTSAWVNSSKTDFTWGANNQPTSFDSYNWNGTSWDHNYKSINATWYQWTGNFDDSKISSFEDQTFDGTNWVNDTKTIINYDAQGNEIEAITETWNSMMGMYMFSNRAVNVYTYDANNNMIQNIYQPWYNNLNSVRNSDKWDYSQFNTVITKVGELNLNNQVEVYPNPTQNSISVNVLTNGLATVYNTIGEVVYTQQLQKGANVIDVSDTSEGVYFINFNNKTTKFIKN